MSKVRKAVFPVAGLGTRFLPATKASPKEMLPIIDKPLIQFAVEEAAAAGATEMIFITGRGKRSIEDHFDKAYELEAELAAKGRDDLLAQARMMMPKGISFAFARQNEALGLGHAILSARDLVGDEPFFVLLADDLMVGANACQELLGAHELHGAPAISCMEVPPADCVSFGMVDGGPGFAGTGRVRGLVEKPALGDSPSSIASLGRYLLTPEVFKLLAEAKPGRGGEIQLSEALSRIASEARLDAVEFKGRRYDCGSKLGYFKAQVDLAMEHPEIGQEARAWLIERSAHWG